MNRKEILSELTPRGRRSLAQKIRRITQRWAKGLLSAPQMMREQNQLYDDLERRIMEARRRR